MILFVNERNEIKDVGKTDKFGLSALVVDDKDNPFMGWSKQKICCYKVQVIHNRIIGFTPYIDTRIMEHFDDLSKVDEEGAIQIEDTQVGLMETYEIADTNSTDIADLMAAVEELYEMMM